MSKEIVTSARQYLLHSISSKGNACDFFDSFMYDK